MSSDDKIIPLVERIAAALEARVSKRDAAADLSASEAFVWTVPHGGQDGGEEPRLQIVETVNRLPLELLQGIDRQIETLIENTRRFAQGLPANNALLWGARGTGKSSLVKAAHAKVSEETEGGLALIEIHREDIATLPALLTVARASDRRILMFCDDLSFDAEDTSYKSLKAILEGGIEGRPENVIFYATSNRRHLMAREMIDNERSTAINPSEAVDEKVSLSDRFGLWLGFHHTDQETYFAMIDAYADHYGLDGDREEMHAQAATWSMTRGARSGRVAWQFIQDLAGSLGKRLD